MSAWRRDAIKLLPDLKKTIEAADNPMALWIELHFECIRASNEESGEPRVAAIFRLARSHFDSPDVEVRTAVACAFYEHLPLNPSLRDEIPRRLSRLEFQNLADIFAYHLDPDELEALRREYQDKHGRI